MSTAATNRTEAPTSEETAVLRALASGPRPACPSAASAALTFGWRGMLKIKHVPEQLLDVTLTPVLFLLMFTYLLGGALAGSTTDYLQYLLPGNLVLSVLFTTVYSGVTLNTDVTKGVVDRFRSLPVWRPAPLVGAMLGDSARYLVAASVVMALGLLMGFRPQAGVVGLVAGVVLVVVFAFGLAWGLYDPWASHARAERGPERRLHDPLSAHLPQQHLRRSEDVAGMASDVRGRQPDLAARDGIARPDGRNGHPLGGWARAAHCGGPDRRVRAAHELPVPAQELRHRALWPT